MLSPGGEDAPSRWSVDTTLLTHYPRQQWAADVGAFCVKPECDSECPFYVFLSAFISAVYVFKLVCPVLNLYSADDCVSTYASGRLT